MTKCLLEGAILVRYFSRLARQRSSSSGHCMRRWVTVAESMLSGVFVLRMLGNKQESSVYHVYQGYSPVYAIEAEEAHAVYDRFRAL